tara:strand:+ start:97 stop:258 length:162 start_codon:yes stop_codon:yes gene_type:complete
MLSLSLKKTPLVETVPIVSEKALKLKKRNKVTIKRILKPFFEKFKHHLALKVD